jgi:hypothetical protein
VIIMPRTDDEICAELRATAREPDLLAALPPDLTARLIRARRDGRVRVDRRRCAREMSDVVLVTIEIGLDAIGA